MSQEASLPLKNLQNILKYINQETEKKIQSIRKEGTQVVEIGNKHKNLFFNLNRKIAHAKTRKRKC